MNIKNIRNIFKKYTCVKQLDDSDCAAACLATISLHYGLKIPITKIREIAGTDRKGTNAYGVILAAESLGFDIDAFQADADSFFQKFTLPAIAHIVNEKGMYHFVVIHSISQKEIVVADPGKGIIILAPDEFFKQWTGVLFILTPSEKFKKGNDSKTIFQRFLYLLKPQKSLILNIFIASILCNLFGILGSFLFKIITDEVIQSRSYQALYTVSFAFIMLIIFKTLFDAFRNHLLIILSQNIDISLILGFYKHLVKLPLKFFDSRKVGEIVSRFQDSSKVRDAISGVTLALLIDTVMALAGAVILFVENRFLFAITCSMIILYAAIVFLFNKPIKNVNRQMMENNAQLTSFIVESINGAETVKSFCAENSVTAKTEKKFVALLKSIFKNSFLINIQHSVSSFITSAGTIIIFLVGSIAVLDGTMTLGQLLAYNSLLIYFFDPISNLINIQPMLQSAIVASDRLGEILDIDTENTDLEENKIELNDIKGKIELKNVSFRYGTRDWVLKNINFTINPGEKVAFVGRSGSGKTTLAKLLLNLYSCQEGSILIDDININDIKKSSLREQISYVPQNTFLFSDTILYNLSFLDSSEKLNDIAKISKLTKTDEFIDTLPHRYFTLLEENGTDLSGGQRQRLSITRALLKEPKILILDEATSNLDSITEKAIEQTIDTLPNNITKIIIAHRLSTIINCDRIFVFENGKIVEAGSHKDLLKLDGIYSKLVKEQMKSVS